MNAALTLRSVLTFFLCIFALAGASPPDSQQILDRYSSRLLREEDPKVLVFSYTVSQLGPRDIEQTHRIYRSGDLVRDETIAVDGVRRKSIRVARYRNRYTLDNLAPRLTQYAFLFQRAIRLGSTSQYLYRAVPIGAASSFVVDEIAIDSAVFLPTVIRFHTAGQSGKGNGSITFGRAGKYWVPSAVSVEASIGGKPARERITFSGYQFPESLPKSTFVTPKPLQTPAPG